jgi:AraC-like DNA-binding protein
MGIWQIGNALTGRELRGDAEFSFAAPSWTARVRHLAPNVRFEAPATRLIFDAETLDFPLVMADPAALALARAECERALEALGGVRGITTRVRALVMKDEGGVRTIDEVAAMLATSTRTLKRRLAGEGSSFSEVLEGEQRARAIAMLGDEARSIAEIASIVGYSDVANFNRAFRRWTGETPASRRKGR